MEWKWVVQNVFSVSGESSLVRTYVRTPSRQTHANANKNAADDDDDGRAASDAYQRPRVSKDSQPEGAMFSRFQLRLCFLALLLATAFALDGTREPGGASLWGDQRGVVVARRTDRPLIGILSQSLGPDSMNGASYDPRNSYIAASYVKFVEAGGARAVPILQDMPAEEIRRRFAAVNGILIPGGSQSLEPGHPYYDATKLLLDLTIEENDKGVHFPLHGTCLGFEALAVAVSGNYSLLQDVRATDAPAALIPTLQTSKSDFFGHMQPAVYKALMAGPVAYENHVHGFDYAAMTDNPVLRDFFVVLTYSLDKDGEAYVSTMEARDYPVSATQWHPEKNAFEWSPDLHIAHDESGVLTTLSVAVNFVKKARQNAHAPASREEENDMLIYNWSPRFSGRDGSAFDQVYVFPPWEDVS